LDYKYADDKRRAEKGVPDHSSSGNNYKTIFDTARE
jgi:hypothetical protein